MDIELRNFIVRAIIGKRWGDTHIMDTMGAEMAADDILSFLERRKTSVEGGAVGSSKQQTKGKIK